MQDWTEAGARDMGYSPQQKVAKRNNNNSG
jgi:hypothetical protein